jgi:radical SAM superfamily enzyme YgiQ (UPF0313 family)
MKVLLVETVFESPLFFAREEPLALEIVAGSLADHDVRILDMRLDPDLEDTMMSFAPDVVATNGVTAQVYRAKALLKRVREIDPRARTVLGGQHATLLPEDFLDPAIDAVVIGPGEFTMPELLRAWERGSDATEVPGLALPRDGRQVRTPPRVVRNLDDAPPPRRDLTGPHRGSYFQELHRPAAMARTSMGCSNRCNFCALWKMAGGRYLIHSPERIVADLKSIREDFCFFADADTFINPRRAEEIVRGIEQERIRKRYRMFVNAQTVIRYPELMERFAGIGLEEVVVGYEAVDDPGLKAFNKNTSAQINRDATKILYDLGIGVRAYFLVKASFTRADFEALARYVEEQGLLTPFFTIETPFPGTDLHDAVRGQLTSSNYEDYDLLHPTLPLTLPAEEFLAEYRKLAVASYGIKRYVRSLVAGLTRMLVPSRADELESRARRLSPFSVVLHAVGSRLFFRKLAKTNRESLARRASAQGPIARRSLA